MKKELARLPKGSNVILHPTAIKAFADKLTAPSASHLHNSRAKLEVTLHLLDDMGELGPIVRELIHAITVFRDEDDGAIVIKVEANLGPFLQDDGKPLGAGPLVELREPRSNLLRAPAKPAGVSRWEFCTSKTKPVTIAPSHALSSARVRAKR